jgi:hypothetical protein
MHGTEEVNRALLGTAQHPCGGVWTLSCTAERFYTTVTCSDLWFGKLTVVANVKGHLGGDSL